MFLICPTLFWDLPDDGALRDWRGAAGAALQRNQEKRVGRAAKY